MDQATSTAELYVRSLQPATGGARQRRVVERLQHLVEAGVLADVELTVWGRQVPREGPIAESEAATSITEAVADVHEWAADAGVAVDGRFTERDVDSQLTGESYSATVLPTMVLVERADGEVQFVAPHERAGSTYTIQDRLARLAVEADLTVGHPDGDVSTTAD